MTYETSHNVVTSPLSTLAVICPPVRCDLLQHCSNFCQMPFLMQPTAHSSQQKLNLGCHHILGANYKKILRLSYDVIITYDYRKLLSHRKIILRFFCN